MTTEKDDSCVTAKSLKEVMDIRFELIEQLRQETDKRYDERFAAQEQARRIYADNLEAWKKHANEFREQLNEERRNFMTRGMGYLIGALTVLLLVVQLFTAIAGG